MARVSASLLLIFLLGCSVTSTAAPGERATWMQTQFPSSNLEALSSKMTLEEKAGQIMMIGFEGTTRTPELRDVITQLHIGGIILFERNVESPQQLAQLTADLQVAARQRGAPGLFISIDQEGGVVARLKEDKGFTEFPGAMAIAATGDVENARRVARAQAEDLRAVGINMNLAPDLDVNNNPANPVISTRSFGSDPERVAAFGVAYIEALQESGIIAIGKHFPGHGDSGVDSHLALPTIPHDRARLQAIEFVPFQAAMKAHVAGIMSAHITFPAIDPTPGLAATLSPRVLTDLLRGEMQYDGLVMTDSLEMGALATSGYPPPQAAAAALKAGADLVLFNKGFDLHRDAHALIVDAVRRGEIPQARLDDALRRVLRVKEKFGILSGTQLKDARAGAPLTKALSREIAAQAITLVRDDARLLPLEPESKILVVETGALGLGKQMGTTTIQVSAQPKPSEIMTVLTAAKDERAVVIATSDIAKNPQQAELVNTLIKANAPIIVVAMRSPYDLLYVKDAPTYLAAYGANPPIIEALAAILTGKSKPHGRLPVELPEMNQ